MRRAVRKVDFHHVLPMAISLLPTYRANTGNARIEVMNDDLGLTDIQYSIALSILFLLDVLLRS